MLETGNDVCECWAGFSSWNSTSKPDDVEKSFELFFCLLCSPRLSSFFSADKSTLKTYSMKENRVESVSPFRAREHQKIQFSRAFPLKEEIESSFLIFWLKVFCFGWWRSREKGTKSHFFLYSFFLFFCECSIFMACPRCSKSRWFHIKFKTGLDRSRPFVLLLPLIVLCWLAVVVIVVVCWCRTPTRPSTPSELFSLSFLHFFDTNISSSPTPHLATAI